MASNFGTSGSWGSGPRQAAFRTRRLHNVAAGTAAQLDTKLDKAGGDIAGDLAVSGSLVVGRDLKERFPLNWASYQYLGGNELITIGGVSLNGRFHQKIVWASGFQKFIAVNFDGGTVDGDGRNAIVSENGIDWETSFPSVLITGVERLEANKNRVSSTDQLIVDMYVNKRDGAGSVPSATKITDVLNGTDFTTDKDITGVDGTTRLYVGLVAPFVEIAYSESLNIAVAAGYNTSAGEWYTEDASNWQKASRIPADAAGIFVNSIAFSPILSRFVAIGNATSTYAISSDGKTWDYSIAPLPVTLAGLCRVKWLPGVNKFLMTTGTTTVLMSSDGLAWAQDTIPIIPVSFGYDPVNDIVVWMTYSGTILRTDSALNVLSPIKTFKTRVDENWNNVQYIAELGLFFALGSNRSRLRFVPAYVSADGLEWRRQVNSAAASLEAQLNFYSIAYSPLLRRLVAPSYAGAVAYVAAEDEFDRGAVEML